MNVIRLIEILLAMSGFDAEIDDHRSLIQWIQTGALLVKPTDKMLHDYLYHFVYGKNGLEG